MTRAAQISLRRKSRTEVRFKLGLMLVAATLGAYLLSINVLADENGVTVGVLAIRGNEKCVRMWTPTVRYLSEAINGQKFYLKPPSLHLDLNQKDWGFYYV